MTEKREGFIFFSWHHREKGMLCTEAEVSFACHDNNICWNASRSLWRHQHSLARVITSSNLSFEALKSRPISFQDMGTEEIWLHLGILTRVRMMVVLRRDQTQAKCATALWISELTAAKSCLGTGECVLHCCSLGSPGAAQTLFLWCCCGSSWNQLDQARCRGTEREIPECLLVSLVVFSILSHADLPWVTQAPWQQSQSCG